MEYGSISPLTQPLSRLVMGTTVCTTDDMERTRMLLDAFVEAGGNALDTAHVYNGGKSERAIGQWMKERAHRAQIFVIDKGVHPNGDGVSRVHPEAIDEDLTESLERLQTDYIDLYLLHRDDPATPVGPLVERLNAHLRAGRVRALGVSNWSVQRIREANTYAVAHGLQGFSASSPYFGLAVQNEPAWPGCLALDAEARAWHMAQQFPLLPWSSQAAGFFTGRYAPDVRSDADMVRIYYAESNWERLRRARELAEVKGASPNQIALAWVLHQPFPVFPLVGPRTLEELRDSLDALHVSLTPAEIRGLSLEDG